MTVKIRVCTSSSRLCNNSRNYQNVMNSVSIHAIRDNSVRCSIGVSSNSNDYLLLQLLQLQYIISTAIINTDNSYMSSTSNNSNNQ